MFTKEELVSVSGNIYQLNDVIPYRTLSSLCEYLPHYVYYSVQELLR
ncbi:MAG: hypothetical protein ACP5DQ_01290 [Bacteroidales bacterium]